MYFFIEIDELDHLLEPNPNEAMPNVSSSESSASTSRTNQTSDALGQPGPSRDQNHIFCEPGPSRPRPSSVVHNNGLDYELNALDNFPDHPVSQGDFDPSNSLIDSMDLEDIQVQNMEPESVDNSSNNTASTASPNAQSTVLPTEDFNENVNENEQEILKCSNCDFETERHCNLQQHINSFIQCSLCSMVFCGRYAKRNHKKHQKEHNPKKTFDCEHCSKSFPIKSLLKKHQLWSKCGRL